MTIALIWAESKTASRNEIRWLGDSELLAKLTLSTRHSMWLRRRDLWDTSSASDWARMSYCSHRGSSECEFTSDHVLICHFLKGESQDLPVIEGLYGRERCTRGSASK